MNEKSKSAHFLEIRELQLLDILYTTRSVTRAAEQLGQTQPTVSCSLRRIRERVREPLFIRTSDGMTPTPRCEIVVAKAREILEAMNLITEAPRFDPFTSTRVFRVCTPDSGQITLLPRMVRYMREYAPNVRLEALLVDDQTAALLETGVADLAFGGFVPGTNAAGFHQQALFEQDFTCLVNAHHPRIKDDLTWDDYQREAHVSVTYGGVGPAIEAAMKRHKIERRVLLQLQGFLGVPKIIATTDMITTLPRQIGATLAATGAIRQFSCPIPIPKYWVKQHWHARFHRDPGNQWLRTVCAKQSVD
jgi:DNA-binding transcriptional LysR family regulator